MIEGNELKKYLLSSWVKFLNYEDIEKVKIPLNSIKKNEAFDFNSVINKDEQNKTMMILNGELKEILNSKYKKTGELFLLFPLIKEVVKNKKTNEETINLIPLFAINLKTKKTSLFNGKSVFFNFKEDNKYQSLVCVFKDIFGIEEDYFNKNFSFLDLVEDLTKIPPKSFIDAVFLLKNFFVHHSKNEKYSLYEKDRIISKIDPSIFNENLIKELNDIKKINIKRDDLIYSYIERTEDEIPPNELGEEIWLGQFDSFSLSTNQSIVLTQNHNLKNKLIAVQGGPGTGKTTLLMSVLSNQLVKRRINIINKKKDYNNLTLITSTSNKSMENITDIFSKTFPGYKHLFLTIGNLEKNKETKIRVDDFLNTLYKTRFSEKKFNSLEFQIKNIMSEIEIEIEEYNELTIFFKELMEKYNCKTFNELNTSLIEELKEKLGEKGEFNLSYKYSQRSNRVKKIKNTRTNKEKIEKIVTENFSNIINNSLKLNLSIKEMIEFISSEQLKDFFSLRRKIHKNKKSFLYLFKNFYNLNENLINKFKVRNKEFIEKFNLTNINDGNIIETLGSIKIILNLKGNYETEISKYKRLMNQDTEEKIKRYELIKGVKEIQQKHYTLQNKYGGNFCEYFRVNKYKENRELFFLCEEYMFWHTLKNKKDVILRLENWKNIFIQNNQTEESIKYIEENLPLFLTSISLVYPFIITTLSSIKNIFKININCFKNLKRFNLFLCDERGMVGVQNLIPRLYRSERGIVIGDTKQLEPIITLPKNVIDEYEENFDSPEDFKNYSPTLVSAYHRTRLSKNKFDQGKSIFLDEHRRCQGKIALSFKELSNYKNLKIKTPELTFNNFENSTTLNNRMFFLLKNSSNLWFYNVINTKNSFFNTNLDELEKIGKILTFLEESGVKLNEDVAIITPFLNQERILKNRFQTKIGKNKIGTIHKFQGTEFPIIIFSSVISKDEDDESFLRNKPNLLNVRISRTKYLFIHVGDYDKLSSSTKPVMKKYIEIVKKHFDLK